MVISERVLGFDHPNTIQQYVSVAEKHTEKHHVFLVGGVTFTSFILHIQALLGVYAFAGGEAVLAQKCFLRARLLTLTVHGEDHPYIAAVDASYISHSRLCIESVEFEVALFCQCTATVNDNVVIYW